MRTRATGPLPDDYFRDLSAYADEYPAAVGPWLAEGAVRLGETLRTAGPDAKVWTPVEGGSASFTHAGSHPRRSCTGPTRSWP